MKKYRLIAYVSLGILSGAWLSPVAATPQFKTIYTFKGGADGAYPATGLLQDKNGALIGATEGDDAPKAFGTVFRLTPPKTANGSWKKVNLYSFKGGADGAYPWTQLIFDLKTGALLGTTAGGDTKTDLGTIFRLVPRAGGKLPWTEQIIHRFHGGRDSGYPYDGLAQEPSNGAIYGTTYGETGETDYGSIFGYTPNLAHSKWTSTLRYNFTGKGGNGAYPEAGLVRGRAGVFFGTTAGGGNAAAPCLFGEDVPGCGSIFVVNPANRKVTFLHLSSGKPDPVFFPYGKLLVDNQFNIYGTSPAGSAANCRMGSNTCGTVFTLDPDTAKLPKVIHAFGGKWSGQSYAGLIWNLSHTALFGTASYGGPNACASTGADRGCGFVFKVTLDGDFSVVHAFAGGADGAKPHDLVIDTEGTLYGEAEADGTKGFGTIFQITSP